MYTNQTFTPGTFHPSLESIYEKIKDRAGTVGSIKVLTPGFSMAKYNRSLENGDKMIEEIKIVKTTFVQKEYTGMMPFMGDADYECWWYVWNGWVDAYGRNLTPDNRRIVIDRHGYRMRSY